MSKISAVGIKALKYTDSANVTADLTPWGLRSLIEDAKTKSVANIHQDTWTLEESEASQDFYRNQLTKIYYRSGVKTPGELKANWTIGQYDYETKKEFLGGELIKDGEKIVGWKREGLPPEIKKCLIILTEDNYYCVLTNANINAYEANSDGAIGISISGTMMEHDLPGVFSEYWFDADVVDKATAPAKPSGSTGS